IAPPARRQRQRARYFRRSVQSHPPFRSRAGPQSPRPLRHIARGHPHRCACKGGRVMGGSSLRRIGWAAVLVVCTALYLALHLRVNAVKSQVLRAERQIVALEQQKLLLETEFETRSNQQQLATWNDVEFGY